MAQRLWSGVSQQHLGEGSPCSSPSTPQRPSGAFQEELERNHISVSKRATMGADLDGACGQLRRRVLQEKKQ